MAGVAGRSGRKPNAVKYQKQIAKATDVMGRMLPEAGQAVVDLALGAYVLMVQGKDGEWVKPGSQRVAELAAEMGVARVYRELPDTKALTIMFERVAGKVSQPLDVRHQLAVDDVIEAQRILMRVIEEHVPDSTLALIRAELSRVAELHSDARSAIGIG